MPDDEKTVSVDLQPWEWESIREGLRVAGEANKILCVENDLTAGPIVDDIQRWLGFRVFITDRLREER